MEIYQYLCDRIGKENIILHDRNILNGKEIDIFIPKLKIGVEYNGLYWHSEANSKGKLYKGWVFVYSKNSKQLYTMYKLEDL